jgi:hypothetical protein
MICPSFRLSIPSLRLLIHLFCVYVYSFLFSPPLSSPLSLYLRLSCLHPCGILCRVALLLPTPVSWYSLFMLSSPYPPLRYPDPLILITLSRFLISTLSSTALSAAGRPAQPPQVVSAHGQHRIHSSTLDHPTGATPTNTRTAPKAPRRRLVKTRRIEASSSPAVILCNPRSSPLPPLPYLMPLSRPCMDPHDHIRCLCCLR